MQEAEQLLLGTALLLFAERESAGLLLHSYTSLQTNKNSRSQQAFKVVIVCFWFFVVLF